jgi:hypothetical protein
VRENTISFCLAFLNLALILDSCFDELYFSVISGLNVKLAVIEVVARTVQEAFPDRYSFLPLSPIVLVHIYMLLYFGHVELL